MVRKDVKKSGIETEVLAYLSKLRKTNNIRRERRFIEKAIAQIEFFLNPPCCDDPNAEGSSFSRFDNGLTIYINASLKGPFDRRKWRKSLVAAQEALRNTIDDPCCELILFRFHSEVPTFDWCTGEWSCDYDPGGIVVASLWLNGCDFPETAPGLPGWDLTGVTNVDINGGFCSGEISEILEPLTTWLAANGFEDYLPLALSEDGVTITSSKKVTSDCNIVLMDITPSSLGFGGAHTPPPVGDDEGQPECEA